MKNLSLKNTDMKISAVGIGCMRLVGLPDEKALLELVDTALENGINFFDHADIYGGGRCEQMFGRAVPASYRDKIVLQSKCCIRRGLYDASESYILQQVDKSLQNLNTDHLDILLLHRPDPLMEPEEIASAFDKLAAAGKVRYFGVSNHNPMQIELINKYVGGRILIDQVQFSIAHCPTIDAGINVNIANDAACVRDGSLIEYARLNDIRLQAWSPFQYGMFEGTFIGSEKYPELNAVLDRLAEKYGCSQNAVAVAWILRHPAGIQTIVGTTNKGRVADIAKACDITLTRDEWYELYLSAGKKLP